jgi:hypothetical protein
MARIRFLRHQHTVSYAFACLPTKFAPLINCFRFILLYYRNFKGPDTPDAIRQRDAIFRFSLTDNFDPSLNSPNI